MSYAVCSTEVEKILYCYDLISLLFTWDTKSSFYDFFFFVVGIGMGSGIWAFLCKL